MEHVSFRRPEAETQAELQSGWTASSLMHVVDCWVPGQKTRMSSFHPRRLWYKFYSIKYISFEAWLNQDCCGWGATVLKNTWRRINNNDTMARCWLCTEDISDEINNCMYECVSCGTDISEIHTCCYEARLLNEGEPMMLCLVLLY
jgi:hypothetical protein